MAHTPGPWTTGPKLHGFDFSIVNPKGDAEVGDWLVAGVRWEANARLIAAAPEHHAVALELERLSLVVESAVRNSDPANRSAILALIMANRAAISRAEGRS